jgi:hypothetical protein
LEPGHGELVPQTAWGRKPSFGPSLLPCPRRANEGIRAGGAAARPVFGMDRRGEAHRLRYNPKAAEGSGWQLKAAGVRVGGRGGGFRDGGVRL